MERIKTYSNIHSHDYYSLLDGHSSPKEILDRCSKLGLKATATTNHGNEFSFYYYAKLQKKYPNVKILYGVEFYEAFNHLEKDPKNKYFHLLILAKNNNGIKAIHELVTKSNFEGFYYKPRIDLEQLKPYANDLIVTNACLAGKVARANTYKQSLKYINEYKSIFQDNFYLEMQCHQSQDQIKFNKRILQLAKDTNTPYIITNDNHYADKTQQKYHSYYVNINRDNADIENINEIYDDCYIHSIDEMYTIMSKSGLTEDEITIGLQNTNKIADLCNGEIKFGKPELPNIPTPPEYKNKVEWFQNLIMQGWNKKIQPNIKNGLVYNAYGKPNSVQVYKDRIIEEFKTMNDMNFIGYHLIVQDFITYAKSKNIAVGKGRGSGAGSLINYLLDITDVDPIPNNLLFSRYLNKDRVTNPDIDSDFESKRRNEVFEYIKEKYGQDKVAQIINFTYITPKVAVKDAGRCLNKSIKDMNALAEFMTQDTIQESIDNANNDEKLKNLLLNYNDVIGLGKRFEGRPRSLSINACGTVICSKSIYSYCGMMQGEDGEQLLQVDKTIAEELGMVKMDLLGLKTLDIIANTMRKLGKQFSDINNIPLDDEKTYKFLAKGMLCGVFQLEGYNMTQFFKKLKPQNLEDICAGISLYRPGAMQYIDNYLEWKEDNDKISYLTEKQKPALESTYGCTIYQEQVMQMLQLLSGFNFAQADLVRRGMAKKKAEYVLGRKNAFIYGEVQLLNEFNEDGNNKTISYEEAKKKYNNNEYKVLIEGCIHNEIKEEIAIEIFNEMEKFSEYAFNKSHGFAYGLLTYITAYLKCHYPLEFMSSVLSYTKDNMKICEYLIECKDLGIIISNPDINISDFNFKVYNNSILYGIGSLYNVGIPKIKQIMKNRPYISFEDFLNKNVYNINENEIKIDKSALISLINSGCFDKLPMKTDDDELSDRQILLMKVFYNSTDLIKSVSTTQIPELFDNPQIDLNEFVIEKYLYELHKYILSKKYYLDLYKDDQYVTSIKNYYTNDVYEIEDNKMKIIKNKYTTQYNKLLIKLKKHLKDNKDKYTMIINKTRVFNQYLNYVKNRDMADLEFESTNFYFQDSWLNTAAKKYNVDEFKDIPSLNMEEVGYYSKKQLYTIVGTLTGKIKKHKEIVLLTNSGIVIAKLGNQLYNNIASDLNRGDKLLLSGYVGNGFFRAEYYQNNKSNKLMALKVLN